ncbi:transcriptional regulator, PadR family [Rhodoblastus acidophilus]|uniref:Transcriptional regulator, PadR family n=1 Tax=Rhodoblastus acidophilus TaxID=1074 RepID=A0A212R8F0_RHOAC|nr:PadR family transcriptional regulator [Rhodoblastus acidophilus]SNB68435.1 transcriptional regulator, PadR family [Rhodoblastus acidophilus]
MRMFHRGGRHGCENFGGPDLDHDAGGDPRETPFGGRRGGWFDHLRAMRGEGFGRHGFGFGRGHGHGGGRGEGGGRKRMFEGGELRLVMLLLIEQEPRHGYDIIRELEARTGGAYAPSPGVVYPTLTLLDETGLIATQASEGAKKLYAITEAGAAELDKSRAEAEAALARLEALRKRGEAMDMGPVFRAMVNLKAVLEQKALDAGNREQLLAVADLIDEAARKIERL